MQDARREYSELGSKDLSELKSFVKGLPKLNMLDRWLAGYGVGHRPWG